MSSTSPPLQRRSRPKSIPPSSAGRSQSHENDRDVRRSESNSPRAHSWGEKFKNIFKRTKSPEPREISVEEKIDLFRNSTRYFNTIKIAFDNVGYLADVETNLLELVKKLSLKEIDYLLDALRERTTNGQLHDGELAFNALKGKILKEKKELTKKITALEEILKKAEEESDSDPDAQPEAKPTSPRAKNRKPKERL